MRAASLTLLLAFVLAGCGGEGGSAPALTDAAVREAPARALAEGTFAFEARYVRQLPGEPNEIYLKLDGAVDLRAQSGRMAAHLAALFEGLPEEPEFDEPIELTWTATRLTAVLQGKEQSLQRARARDSAGLIGRLPDEPAALLALLGRADEIRRVGDERVDGRRTTRFTCSVDARRAGRTGVPAELAGAFAQALHGPRLPLDVWLDADGLPRRIEYVIRLKPLSGAGRQLLPARVVRGRYDLFDFGAPVDVTR